MGWKYEYARSESDDIIIKLIYIMHSHNLCSQYKKTIDEYGREDLYDKSA